MCKEMVMERSRQKGELQEQEHNRHSTIQYMYASQRISGVLTPFMVLAVEGKQRASNGLTGETHVS